MKTPIEKIFEMLENNDISNLSEMKEWFLNEEKEFLKKSFDYGFKNGLDCDLHASFDTFIIKYNIHKD